MQIMNGQYNHVVSAFGAINKDLCSVIAEGGSDNGKTFSGSFLVKIKRKGVFRFDDGVMTKKVK